MDPHFVLFGTAHLVAIALAFTVPILLAIVVRMSGSAVLNNAVRWAFALELVATYLLWFWLLYKGIVGNMLPMHLCDWAAIAAIVTLFRPNQKSYELAYFWTFTGTVLATLTPELTAGWPDLRFVIFFAFHCGVIAAVLYMTLGMKMRPTLRSIPRVIAWTIFYGIVAGLVDWLTNANYGFLRNKPGTATMFDLLSPWPWYIAEMVPIAIVFILILYSPFFIADRLRRRP